jgi:hypothetical protein
VKYIEDVFKRTSLTSSPEGVALEEQRLVSNQGGGTSTIGDNNNAIALCDVADCGGVSATTTKSAGEKASDTDFLKV